MLEAVVNSVAKNVRTSFAEDFTRNGELIRDKCPQLHLMATYLILNATDIYVVPFPC